MSNAIGVRSEPPRYDDRRTGIFVNVGQFRTEYVIDGVVEAWITLDAPREAVEEWKYRYVIGPTADLKVMRWLAQRERRE